MCVSVRILQVRVSVRESERERETEDTSPCVCARVCDHVRRLQVPRSNAARPQSGVFAPARRGRGLWGGAATILEREAEQSRLGATERAAAAAMNPE